jgi:phage shock protein C
MYCTRCGAQNTDGASFCTACGASLLSQTAGAPQAGVPPGAAGFAGSGAAPPYSAVPPRRLKRVMAQKKIAGVCAGFAEYFDMDVTLVRLIWFGVSVMSGIVPGVMVYIVAWIILPSD